MEKTALLLKIASVSLITTFNTMCFSGETQTLTDTHPRMMTPTQKNKFQLARTQQWILPDLTKSDLQSVVQTTVDGRTCITNIGGRSYQSSSNNFTPQISTQTTTYVGGTINVFCQ